MCGRLACGLQPEEASNTCCYKLPNGDGFQRPEWKSVYNGGKTYKPSFNVSPTDLAPVLLSGKGFGSHARILAPMVFGVIPKWVKSISNSKYSTINCRVETCLTSKLYGNLLQRGQRCAVVCNGFYEWKKEPGKKKPYFIHGKQSDGVVIDDPQTWNLNFSADKGVSGFSPLKLAAVYEINFSSSLEEATLSFAIITKPATSHTAWLHEREPAVLETEEELEAWLSFDKLAAKEAVALLNNEFKFIFVPVSDLVNKNTNKDISCIKQKKESKENKERKSGSATLLSSWLEKGGKRASGSSEEVALKIKKN